MTGVDGRENFGLIDLPCLVGRMSQLVGQVAVVGEHQKAFRILVQSAGAEKPSFRKLLGQQIENGFFFRWVIVRANVSCRFVHHEADCLRRNKGKNFAFHFHGVLRRIHLLSRLRRTPVDLHLPELDQAFRFPTRAYSTRGQQLLYAYWFEDLFLSFPAAVFSFAHLFVDMPEEILQKSTINV